MLAVVKKTTGLFLLSFQGILYIRTLHLNFQSLEPIELSFKFMVLHMGSRVHLKPGKFHLYMYLHAHMHFLIYLCVCVPYSMCIGDEIKCKEKFKCNKVNVLIQCYK